MGVDSSGTAFIVSTSAPLLANPYQNEGGLRKGSPLIDCENSVRISKCTLIGWPVYFKIDIPVNIMVEGRFGGAWSVIVNSCRSIHIIPLLMAHPQAVQEIPLAQSRGRKEQRGQRVKNSAYSRVSTFP